MTKLKLIQNVEYHPFMLDYIYEFQRAFLEAFPNAKCSSGRFIGFKRQVLRVFRHLYKYLPMKRITFPLGKRDESSFSVICGGDFAYCLPSALISKRNYLYIFDAWPRANSVLVDWVNLFSIDKVFFSALQSAELFNTSFKEKRGFWIPEGIDSRDYYDRPYNDKDIDVIEFGRRYEMYHDKIAPALAAAGYRHYYKIGKVNEPLSRAKLSICFPSSLTHPERSEYISTMTLRYLQSMISKCLVVGECPYDMQYLFDYDPVIKANLDDPAGQLLSILDNYRDYIPLIDRNYRTVMARHLWANRIEMMKSHLT